MRIMAVDDERIALTVLNRAIREAAPDAELISFENPEDAIQFARTNDFDVAFLDILMGATDGVNLARVLKLLNPKINIIFATGDTSFYGDAFQLHVSGYLLKPITTAKVKTELDNLRNSVVPHSNGKRMRIQCFGNFEVFVDDKPVTFRLNKTKELFAYLVDRGTMCQNGEIIAALWENDDSKASYLRKLIKDLEDTLTELGCADVIIRQWGGLGVDITKVECDYYNWKNGIATGINAYRGEYMSQYSWGELTHGLMERKNYL